MSPFCWNPVAHRGPRTAPLHKQPLRPTLMENHKAERWTLADLMVRMLCTDYRRREVTALLAEDHRLPAGSGAIGEPLPRWSLPLHGAAD